MNLIIGIDPGETQSTTVWFDADQRCACRGRQWRDKNEAIIGLISNPGLLGAMVCEDIESRGMLIGQSTIETAKWIGRFVEASGGRLILIPPRVIKQEICGTHMAKDKNLRAALIDILGPPGTKKNPGPTYSVSTHGWRALAVAVTHWRRSVVSHLAVTPKL